MKPWEKYKEDPSVEKKPWEKRGAKKVAAQDDDFSVMEMAKNIPGSVANQFKILGGALFNPIDTAQGVSKMGAGVASSYMNPSQGVPNLDTGVMEETANTAPMQEFLPYSQAAKSFQDNRHGDITKSIQTLERDPAGFMMDMSGLVAPVSPALATKINPISATMRGVNKARQAIPKSLPRGIYERTAKFSTTIPKPKREAMIDTALEYGIYPNQKGVDKLNRLSSAINNKIDDLIAQSTDSKKGVPINAVFKHLKELRDEKGGIKIGSKKDLSAIDSYAKELNIAAKESGKKTYTAKDLQTIKRDLYEQINWDAKRQAGSPIKEDTFKALAKGAKEGVEQAAPETKALNKAWGSILELEPQLQKAANRIENRDIISLKAAPNIISGSILSNGAGAAAGAILSVLENPKISGRAAIWINKMKETGKLANFLAENTALSQAEFLSYIEQEPKGIYQ